MSQDRLHQKLRKLLRLFFRLTALAVLLLAASALFWLRGALYHRFVSFPREEAAWQSLRAQRRAVSDTGGWHEYRGILHSHSHLSHDSDVTFPQILAALQDAGVDFICLSDHAIDGRADFNWQWRGIHGGKLFIPGFELKEGLMPFGAASNLVVSNRMDSGMLARKVVENGGVLFYAHSEEEREWSRPELTGMEIYNLHSDLKQQRGGISSLVPDVLLNLRRHPDHLYYRLFHRPTEFLHLWDDLNRTRHLTGIAGNDCHQNVGLRALCTTNNTIRLEDTSRKALREFRLNPLARTLARMTFGPLKPGRVLLHFQLDPYERSARFVNTHVLARELSEQAILDSLRAGRVFVAFDMIADSSGFCWFATQAADRAAMGETFPLGEDTHLRAVSPLPCRFTVIKDGDVLARREGRTLDQRPSGPGKYRVEAELNVLGRWVPWVYANPIELR